MDGESLQAAIPPAILYSLAFTVNMAQIWGSKFTKLDFNTKKIPQSQSTNGGDSIEIN